MTHEECHRSDWPGHLDECLRLSSPRELVSQSGGNSDGVGFTGRHQAEAVLGQCREVLRQIFRMRHDLTIIVLFDRTTLRRRKTWTLGLSRILDCSPVIEANHHE